MNKYQIMLAIVPAVVVLTGFSGCERSEADEDRSATAIASVSEDGKTITFAAGNPGLRQVTVSTASKGSITTTVIAPARVVANILPGEQAGRVLLFDSPDATTLYSQYKQSQANENLAVKNLTRVQDMFQNQGATLKDLNQAETDVSNAKAVRTEMEGRLRAAGFEPRELDETPAGSVWILSDVTESQLSEVDKGEDVDVTFNAFPGRKFTGRATAIGDVIDPVTRTVKVRIVMRVGREKILPGMFAKVDFGDPKSGVIVVPITSVLTAEGRDFLFVETAPGVFTRREVIISPPEGEQAIVLRGVREGEKIVTGGTMLLKGLSFNY
ncbi:MAG TPA: efflux RND transporter periplasmic adaptor subunit [Bacteroidota bacterium]|nr:efflux RND transporter periplasmic adaptor subunit [Bacteroidota bacterium]